MYMARVDKPHNERVESTCVHSTCMHVHRGLRISCLLASLNEGRAGRRINKYARPADSLHFLSLVILRYISYMAYLSLAFFYSILSCIAAYLPS